MTDTPPAPEQTHPAGAAPVTIDLGELTEGGEWAGQTVTIRPHISYAAQSRIDAAAARMFQEAPGNRAQRRAARDAPSTIVAETTPMDYAAAVVEECVLSWTIAGHDGRPLPANREGVTSDNAPASLLDAAIDEILVYYEQRTPKLRKRR